MKEAFQQWRTKALRDVLVGWLRPLWCTPPEPDPWPEEVQLAIMAPDAIEVCHHCFTPLGQQGWFCPQCGASVGQYNNWMSYVYIFSQGEVLRSGVGPEARFTWLTVPGYIVLGLLAFGVFSPVYFFRLFMNWRKMSRKKARPTVHQVSS